MTHAYSCQQCSTVVGVVTAGRTARVPLGFGLPMWAAQVEVVATPYRGFLNAVVIMICMSTTVCHTYDTLFIYIMMHLQYVLCHDGL